MKREKFFMGKSINFLSSLFRGFIQSDCYSKASALTFYSLLSIVPMLAVALGIAKGFGFDQLLEAQILYQFRDQREFAHTLINFAYSWLQHVQGGVIAGVGVVFLFWSILSLLSNIEKALNDVWKVKDSRTFSRRFSDYLATIVICPVVFVISSSLTVFLATQVVEGAKHHGVIEWMSPYLFMGLRLFPFLLSWILFSFTYLFIPNTKVSPLAGIIGGILAGTAFQIWQLIYIIFQASISSYGAIYGSFAALPLFLLWLQYSWLIVLGGAQIAFQLENELFISLGKKIIIYKASAKVIAILIVHHCNQAFMRGEPPMTDHALVKLIGTPINKIRYLLSILQNQGLLNQVTFGYAEVGHQPARVSQTMTIKQVCDAVDESLSFEAPIYESNELHQVTEYLKELNRSISRADANIAITKI